MLGGAVLAAFVQGLSGFGYAMTAMAVWAWVLDPRTAAVLGVFGSLVGQLIAAATVRRGFDLARLWPFLAGALAGLPLGLWLLPRMDIPAFQAFLGALLVVLCPLLFVAPSLPPVRRGGRAADAASGAVGGAMAALGGFSGVAPTLWCTLRGMPRDAQRSVIQNFNLAVLAVAFGTYLATGLVQVEMLPLFGLVAPAMLVPALLGGRIYHGLSDVAFRRVVLGLLTAAGVALLASGGPVVWRRLVGA